MKRALTKISLYALVPFLGKVQVRERPDPKPCTRWNRRRKAANAPPCWLATQPGIAAARSNHACPLIPTRLIWLALVVVDVQLPHKGVRLVGRVAGVQHEGLRRTLIKGSEPVACKCPVCNHRACAFVHPSYPLGTTRA